MRLSSKEMEIAELIALLNRDFFLSVSWSMTACFLVLLWTVSDFTPEFLSFLLFSVGKVIVWIKKQCAESLHCKKPKRPGCGKEKELGSTG